MDSKTLDMDYESAVNNENDFLKLPEIVQVKILNSCDFETLLRASQTCHDIRDLVLTVRDLNKRINFLISPKHSQEYLFDNGQIFPQIKIGFWCCLDMDKDENSQWEATVVDFFKTRGHWIKELTFNGVRGQDLTMVQLLSHCPNVEMVKVCEDDQLHFKNFQAVELTKLTELDFSGIASRLETFSAVTTLKILKINSIDREDLVHLEDLIIQQDNLKHLSVEVTRPQALFQLHRLNDIKFQLESFATDNSTIDPSAAAKFFAQQQSLKEVKLDNFYRRESFAQRADYSKIIAIILSLPQLRSLDLGDETIGIEDFEVMAGIKNKSVKRLRFVGDMNVYNKFVSMLPNLADVRIKNCRCGALDVERISVENLAILDAPGLRELAFQPEVPPNDQKMSEDQLIDFVARHKSIQRLIIGNSSWNENNFSFSLRFWVEVCQLLPALQSIVVFHLPEIKKFISIVSGHESLSKIEILATADSRQAFDELEAVGF